MACNGANNDRVVALVDMDCFYVQVEERDYPAIKGRPAAVVQYNTHRGGGIIAVNYEARACGVKRGMRGTDASELCPGISLVRVPMLRNKANLQKYRNAGKEVLTVLCGYSDLVERASIDEAYLDLTRVVDEKIEQWRRHQAATDVGSTSIRLGGENGQNDSSEHGASVSAQNSFDLGEKEAQNDGVKLLEITVGQEVCLDRLNNVETSDLDGVEDESWLLPEDEDTVPKSISSDTSLGEKNISDSKTSTVISATKSPLQYPVQTAIPTLDELKSTWVKLPDDQTAPELRSEYDLADNGQRKKYELDETFVSQWTPRAEDEVEMKQDQSEQNVEGEEKEEERDASVSTIDKTAAKTEADKEAERVGDLTKWLNTICEDYTRYSSSLNEESASSSKDKVSSTTIVSDAIAPLRLGDRRRSSSGLNSRRGSDGGAATESLADLRLAVAARVCEEMRATVLKETGFKCSAGIAHNKVLAKLVCGLHKPNQQTVIPGGSVMALWRDTSIHKVRNLGGKLGESLMTDFGCKTMADLSELSLAQLQGRFDDKTAFWLHGLGRGQDSEAVVSRQLAKSVGCSKNFLGRESLYTRARVEEWARALAEELSERLQEDMDMNKRVARSLTVGLRQGQPQGGGASNYGTRCCPLTSYAPDRITTAVLTVLETGNTAKQHNLWSPPILNISLSASKFEDSFSSGMPSISDMFKRVVQKQANVATGEGSSKDCEASTSRAALSVTHANNGTAHTTEITDGVSKDNGTGTSSTVSPLNNGPTRRQKGGIFAYLTEEQSRPREISSATTVSNDSDPDDPVKVSHKKDEREDTGNSFFKRFLMKKMSSANDQGNSSEGVNGNKSSTVYDDDDSCDAAINLLVDQLDADSDNEEGSFKRDLEINPICKDKPVTNGCDAETTPENVYDDSTDSNDSNDHSKILPGTTKAKSSNVKSINSCGESRSCNSKQNSESTRITNPDNAGRAGDSPRHTTASTSAPPVSVTELFPDLDSVDESLLPMLPLDLRRAVAQALEKHKADKAGKEALRKTGMWRYMKKGEGSLEGRRQRDSESERLVVDEEEHKEPLASSHRSKAQSTEDVNDKIEPLCSCNIKKYMTKQVRNGECNDGSLLRKNISAKQSCSDTRNSNSRSAVNVIPPGCSINLSKLATATDDSSESSNCTRSDLGTSGEKLNVDSCIDVNNSEETIACDRCGAHIPLTDIEEHSDYHVALDLQKQFGGASSSSSTWQGCGASAASDSSRKSTTLRSSQTKPGKRKLSSKAIPPETKKNKTIDTFFKK